MKGKQIVMPAKRSATLEDFELDETLTPNQILLKTHYSLISPGTEGAGFTHSKRERVSPTAPVTQQ